MGIICPTVGGLAFSIQFESDRTCLPTSFHKNSLKSPFTYIGTKKAKNSHLKIKFFQKNLRAAETAPKSGKSGYIIVSNCGKSNQQ